MQIVIVGGGFGGVKAALELSKRHQNVTLISDKDYFLYYPALYATATGHSHLQSVVPLEEIFEDTSVTIITDTVHAIDSDRRTIKGELREYQYDQLILALGVVTSYFGIKGLPEYSYSIKSYDEVQRFKTHLHQELAQDHHVDKHYVVVGAGPTGVELSAALASYLEDIADAHKVRHGKISIQLVEAAPRVLPRMSERASERVRQRLKSLGVQVMTNEKVESENDNSILVSGKSIPSKTVIWTSGVSNHPFFKEHEGLFSLTPNGRVEVDDHLRAAAHIYVIGDNAATPYTGLAQTALHDAIFIAKVMRAISKRHPLPAYKAVKPPVVVPVGKNWAILEYGRIVMTGPLASLIRRAADLIGYHDVLPIGQALGVWHAETINEESCDVCLKTLVKAQA